MTVHSEQFPPYHPNPKRPRFGVLAGAWDTQFHAYVPGGKAADPKGAYAPVDAPMAAANAMHAAIGIDRAVLVQNVSEIPNYDAFIADLLANPRLRGVVTMRQDATDADLKRLHEAGVRGIRFHFVDFLNIAPSLEYFKSSVRRIAKLGWHVIVNLQPKQLEELAKILREAPVPVVINHQAHIDVTLGADQSSVILLTDLQRSPNIWVQLSAGDRYSGIGRPSYSDVARVSRVLALNAPERAIWASDWPHAQYNRRRISETPPDEGDLLNLLYDSADGNMVLLRKILVENPARLYE